MVKKIKITAGSFYPYFMLCGMIMLSAFVLLSPLKAFAQQAYISISDPHLKKSPVAVPDFMLLSSQGSEAELARQARDILANALEFTGYITVLNKASYIEQPAVKGITLAEINFKNWTVIGTDLLVTGGLVKSGDGLQLKMRLFDPFTERLLVGKVYTGRDADLKKMVYRFCSEICFYLTGKWGLFSSELTFVSTKGANKEIFISEFDGSNPRQVTNLNSISLSPTLSADGQWLAYTSYVNGNPDLYIKNVKDNRGAAVRLNGVNITPDWLPGQFALAATLSFSGDQEIYLLTGQGKVIKRLTNSLGIDVSPAFSADGRKMAFVSARTGTPQIYIMDLASGATQRLTFKGRYNTSPAWSPDGDKIAYVAIANGGININMIGLDGTDPVQLTHNAGDNEGPSWSPDGSLITFSSTREGVSRIFVMTSNGGDQRRLFTMGGAQTDSEWSQGNEGN